MCDSRRVLVAPPGVDRAAAARSWREAGVLTPLGHAHFEWTDRDADLTRYRVMEAAELVEWVHALETQVEASQTAPSVVRAPLQRLVIEDFRPGEPELRDDD